MIADNGGPRMTDLSELKLYQPHETQNCTDAFYRFMVEYDKIVGLFFFIVSSADIMDRMQATAAHALSEETERISKTVDDFNKKQMSKKVREYSSLLSRNLVLNMANNFHCYLSEILQAVIEKRYEILKSSERLTTEEVLQFSRIQDLRSYLVDKKINELSYGGLRLMQEYLSDRLGVKMFAHESQQALLTIFIELRNIHTHNRGIVNQLFLNRIGKGHPNFKFKEGVLYHVDLETFILLSRNAISVALHLDEALSKKFRLKRKHYKNRITKDRVSKNPLVSNNADGNGPSPPS
jgi:hypothetical protein